MIAELYIYIHASSKVVHNWVGSIGCGCRVISPIHIQLNLNLASTGVNGMSKSQPIISGISFESPPPTITLCMGMMLGHGNMVSKWGCKWATTRSVYVTLVNRDCSFTNSLCNFPQNTRIREPPVFTPY